MTDKKVIAIGATGAQGGGLAHAILRDRSRPFAARAITRNPDSDKARALADLGAEVAAADADDPKSLDAAFAGAFGATASRISVSTSRPSGKELRRRPWRRRPSGQAPELRSMAGEECQADPRWTELLADARIRSFSRRGRESGI